MRLVDWCRFLPYGTHVEYSTLRIPDKRHPLNRDVAEIRLASGDIIDIEWLHRDHIYIVSLYDQSYDGDIVDSAECADVNEVISHVKRFARKNSSFYDLMSDGTSETRSREIQFNTRTFEEVSAASGVL